MSLGNVEILTESELDTLAGSSGDDCCMASVKCVVNELRALRRDRNEWHDALVAEQMCVAALREQLVAANAERDRWQEEARQMYINRDYWRDRLDNVCERCSASTSRVIPN